MDCKLKIDRRMPRLFLDMCSLRTKFKKKIFFVLVCPKSPENRDCVYVITNLMKCLMS